MKSEGYRFKRHLEDVKQVLPVHQSLGPSRIGEKSINENLIRNELHYTDRGNQLARRKEIYEELYPETRKGAVNQHTKVQSADSADSKPSFVVDTSAKTGKSERVIHEELQIAKNIAPEIQEVIKEKGIVSMSNHPFVSNGSLI